MTTIRGKCTEFIQSVNQSLEHISNEVKFQPNEELNDLLEHDPGKRVKITTNNQRN